MRGMVGVGRVVKGWCQSALESKPPNLPHYIAPGLIKICDKLKSFKGKYRRSVLQKSPKAFDLQCFDQTFHRYANLTQHCWHLYCLF